MPDMVIIKHEFKYQNTRNSTHVIFISQEAYNHIETKSNINLCSFHHNRKWMGQPGRIWGTNFVIIELDEKLM